MISIVLPVIADSDYLYELTKFTVWCMRNLTKIKHELIIVETETKRLSEIPCETYIWLESKSSYSADWNRGAEEATGDYVVHIGNDIIVSDGWLEALLDCYDYSDCGVASLACTEPGSVVGAKEPIMVISEGWYGPLMMLPNDCRLDDKAFPSLGSDSDLILRQYEKGLRAYRNNAVVCHHLDGATYRRKPALQRQQETARVHQSMVGRWGGSPLWAAKMVLRGYVGQFGKEAE